MTGTGLPTGPVTVIQEGYNLSCASVVATSTPTWVSNQPAGQLSGNCQPSTSYPVAYYASHGANGYNAFSPTKATGEHICSTATSCKSGYPTQFCSFVGLTPPTRTAALCRAAGDLLRS